MAAKARDYARLAADIKDTLGESNIISATHCATRLRLVLKEKPGNDITKKIEQMPAVIQVVQAGGQYQIVIGMHAKDVYENLSRIMTFSGDVPEVKQSMVNQVIAMMSGCIAPFVYVLAAAGLLQGLLIIINLFVDISGTGAGQLYDMISWTPFTFLPVFIAVAGSRHFKCNTYIALWCCLALTNPTWGSIADTIAEGSALKFLFIPLTSVKYTSTVIPPIVLVGVLSLLEHWIEPKLPDVLKAVATPFICTVIMVPLTIMVIGPVSTIIANALADGYNMLYSVLPWLASGVLAFFWQVFVIFGVHWSFTPINMANFETVGYDVIQPCMAIAVCAQTAACLGVFIKSRNSQIKNVAGSAAATGLFGITEPAIYGVTLRFKKPFFCGCAGAALGGIICSFFRARYFVYAGLAGFLTIPNGIYNAAARARCEGFGTASDSFSSGIIGILAGTVVACVAAFILVQIVGFDDPVEIPPEAMDDTPESDPEPQKTPAAYVPQAPAVSNTLVYAPLNGKIVDLTEVPDDTFAGGILGQGVAILPSEGRLYSPVDGIVSSIFETKHAICLETFTGAEMLIHIGLETVSLQGRYFEAKVQADQRVKKGDLLIEFNLNEIKKNFQTYTPVLVTNADEFGAIDILKQPGPVKVGEPLFEARL